MRRCCLLLPFCFRPFVAFAVHVASREDAGTPAAAAAEVALPDATADLRNNSSSSRLAEQQEREDTERNQKTALLVIDVQQDFWSANANIRAAFPEFPENIQQLLRRARGGGSVVEGVAPVALIVHVRAVYGLERGSRWTPFFKELNPEKKAESVRNTPEPFALAPWEMSLRGWSEPPWTTSSGGATPVETRRGWAATPSRGTKSGKAGADCSSPFAWCWSVVNPPTEVLVEKPNFDAFLDTSLDGILQRHGVGNVIIAGMVTSACVQASAFSAFMRGYRVTLVRDCLADRSVERHEDVLGVYENYLYKVKNLDEVFPVADDGDDGVGDGCAVVDGACVVADAKEEKEEKIPGSRGDARFFDEGEAAENSASDSGSRRCSKEHCQEAVSP
eukprot:g3370.t1